MSSIQNSSIKKLSKKIQLSKDGYLKSFIPFPEEIREIYYNLTPIEKDLVFFLFESLRFERFKYTAGEFTVNGIAKKIEKDWHTVKIGIAKLEERNIIQTVPKGKNIIIGINFTSEKPTTIRKFTSSISTSQDNSISRKPTRSELSTSELSTNPLVDNLLVGSELSTSPLVDNLLVKTLETKITSEIPETPNITLNNTINKISNNSKNEEDEFEKFMRFQELYEKFSEGKIDDDKNIKNEEKEKDAKFTEAFQKLYKNENIFSRLCGDGRRQKIKNFILEHCDDPEKVLQVCRMVESSKDFLYKTDDEKAAIIINTIKNKSFEVQPEPDVIETRQQQIVKEQQYLKTLAQCFGGMGGSGAKTTILMSFISIYNYKATLPDKVNLMRKYYSYEELDNIFKDCIEDNKNNGANKTIWDFLKSHGLEGTHKLLMKAINDNYDTKAIPEIPFILREKKPLPNLVPFKKIDPIKNNQDAIKQVENFTGKNFNMGRK